MSEWIKCADRMPDCVELRKRPHEALFWVYMKSPMMNKMIVNRLYRRFYNNRWLWCWRHDKPLQIVVRDDDVTHYMPIIQPAPPQD